MGHTTRNATPLAALALLCSAAALSGCTICRDGDIGSRDCLAAGGGMGSGYKAPLAVVENVAWLPYKAVATPVTGLVQGGVGWYELTGEPVSATLTLPVGMAFGLVVGTANALGQEPMLVERDDNFFEVLANPYITDQEVYKYTTPPRGRPAYAEPGPMAEQWGDESTRERVQPYGYARSYNAWLWRREAAARARTTPAPLPR